MDLVFADRAVVFRMYVDNGRHRRLYGRFLFGHFNMPRNWRLVIVDSARIEDCELVSDCRIIPRQIAGIMDNDWVDVTRY